MIILVPLQNLLRPLLPHNHSCHSLRSTHTHSRRCTHHLLLLLLERCYLHPLPQSLPLPLLLPQDHLTLQDFPPLDHLLLPPQDCPPHRPPPHNRSSHIHRSSRRNNHRHYLP